MIITFLHELKAVVLILLDWKQYEKKPQNSNDTRVVILLTPLYLVLCTLYSVLCTLYPLPCTLYPIPCTLYSSCRSKTSSHGRKLLWSFLRQNLLGETKGNHKTHSHGSLFFGQSTKQAPPEYEARPLREAAVCVYHRKSQTV
jgi:hypothetical protein